MVPTWRRHADETTGISEATVFSTLEDFDQCCYFVCSCIVESWHTTRAAVVDRALDVFIKSTSAIVMRYSSQSD